VPEESWYARPVFFVTDCETALRFYSRLGFEEAWRHEEDGVVVAAQVNRSGAELILNHNGKRAGGGRLFLSLHRGEVARHAAAFAAAGIDTQDGQWGMAVKIVRDPDGNDLLFRDDSMDG
jgi:catechol 2,3-dioxygenase-like lactoylglutathione lyase family enzyme